MAMITNSSATHFFSDVQTWARNMLAKSQINPARHDEELKILSRFFMEGDGDLQASQTLFKRAVKLRTEEHFPIAYLTGKAAFGDLDFYISNEPPEAFKTGWAWSKDIYKTYVPREETTWLVQEMVQDVQRRLQVNSSQLISVVDIATGSGCIPVSLKKMAPQAIVTAIEISSDAIAVARRNCEKHQVDIRLLQGSWFEPVSSEQFDIVICNPPYVPQGQENLLSSGARHEPPQSHYPELAPKILYQHLLQDTKKVLAPGGLYLFEMGFEQFADTDVNIVDMAYAAGLSAQVFPDKEGFARFFKGGHL